MGGGEREEGEDSGCQALCMLTLSFWGLTEKRRCNQRYEYGQIQLRVRIMT